MTNLYSILESRAITLLTKVHTVKVLDFPCMDVKVGPQRRLTVEEVMFLNCGAEQDS